MAKATVSDVIDLGFSAVHFGGRDDFDLDNEAGYVHKILTDIAMEVRGYIGAGIYDAAAFDGSDAEKLNFARIKSAEINLCAADLFSRRIIFLENNAGRAIENIDELMAELRRNAQKFEDNAWRTIALITGTTQNGSFSSGVLETGLYPAVNS